MGGAWRVGMLNLEGGQQLGGRYLLAEPVRRLGGWIAKDLVCREATCSCNRNA